MDGHTVLQRGWFHFIRYFQPVKRVTFTLVLEDVAKQFTRCTHPRIQALYVRQNFWFHINQPARHRNIKSDQKVPLLYQAAHVCVICVLPPVVCQVLLQLCYPTELVEEPLVYGCQLVDLIDTHSTVEGLKSTDMKQIGCYIHYSLSSRSSSMAPTGAFWKQTSKRFHKVSTDSIINGLWLKSWCKSVSENSLKELRDNCFE